MEGHVRRGGTRSRRYGSRRKESAKIYREKGWKAGDRIDWESCQSQDATTDVEDAFRAWATMCSRNKVNPLLSMHLPLRWPNSLSILFYSILIFTISNLWTNIHSILSSSQIVTPHTAVPTRQIEVVADRVTCGSPSSLQ